MKCCTLGFLWPIDLVISWMGPLITGTLLILGLCLCPQLVARGMKTRGSGGSIVNVSSQASQCALKDHTVYCKWWDGVTHRDAWLWEAARCVWAVDILALLIHESIHQWRRESPQTNLCSYQSEDEFRGTVNLSVNSCMLVWKLKSTTLWVLCYARLTNRWRCYQMISTNFLSLFLKMRPNMYKFLFNTFHNKQRQCVYSFRLINQMKLINKCLKNKQCLLMRSTQR